MILPKIIANVAIHMKISFTSKSFSFFENDKGLFTGCASSVGEQSIFGLIDPISMVHKTFAEALTNLVWVLVENDISASANAESWSEISAA
mgnify:CR=1 FL=1